jgi:K+-sensing histidine kinase KdpD
VRNRPSVLAAHGETVSEQRTPIFRPQRFLRAIYLLLAGNIAGMGLAIARTIVEAHGGRLWAENRASGGAIFHLMVPVTRGPAKR